MAWRQWTSRPSGQKQGAGATGQEARTGRLGTPVLLMVGAGLTLVGLFLAGVTIWASHRTLPAISDQSASRQQGMAAGLGSDSEPSMSDIPTANPAYPAPVESPPEAALGLYHPP